MRKSQITSAMQVLIRRDGNTPREARDRIVACRRHMEDANFDPDECEQILIDDLGLELDYLFDIIW